MSSSENDDGNNDFEGSRNEPNEEKGCAMRAKWTPPEQPLPAGCSFPDCSGCTSSSQD
jgi:hypothetical protein